MCFGLVHPACVAYSLPHVSRTPLYMPMPLNLSIVCRKHCLIHTACYAKSLPHKLPIPCDNSHRIAAYSYHMPHPHLDSTNRPLHTPRVSLEDGASTTNHVCATKTPRPITCVPLRPPGVGLLPTSLPRPATPPRRTQRVAPHLPTKPCSSPMSLPHIHGVR